MPGYANNPIPEGLPRKQVSSPTPEGVVTLMGVAHREANFEAETSRREYSNALPESAIFQMMTRSLPTRAEQGNCESAFPFELMMGTELHEEETEGVLLSKLRICVLVVSLQMAQYLPCGSLIVHIGLFVFELICDTESTVGVPRENVDPLFVRG